MMNSVRGYFSALLATIFLTIENALPPKLRYGMAQWVTIVIIFTIIVAGALVIVVIVLFPGASTTTTLSP
jgi:uncharacterized membrane protein